MNDTVPPGPGYRRVRCTYAYAVTRASAPPTRNEIHVAPRPPTTVSPKVAKNPPPTIPPMPMDSAPPIPIVAFEGWAAPGVVATSVPSSVQGSPHEATDLG